MGAFGGEFILDTGNMEFTASECEKLAGEMTDLKLALDKSTLCLRDNWDGRGGKAFKKKYHYLIQQLEDIDEQLYDIAEAIRVALDGYIQADMDEAKLAPGKEQIPRQPAAGGGGR